MNIQDLLPKILEATRKKKIDWHQIDDKTFTVKVGHRRFEVHQGFDDDSEQPVYQLGIYEAGISEFERQFIDSMYADRFRGAFSDLEELFSEARRNALNIDDVITDIADELDNLLQ